MSISEPGIWIAAAAPFCDNNSFQGPAPAPPAFCPVVPNQLFLGGTTSLLEGIKAYKPLKPDEGSILTFNTKTVALKAPFGVLGSAALNE